MGRKKRYTIGVGFLFDYLHENYSFGLFRSIQAACRELDLGFVGFEGGSSKISALGRYHRQKIAVIDLIDKRTCDGMILLGEQVTNTLTDGEIRRLRNALSGLPVVSIGRFDRATATILVDNTESYRELVRHLIEAHGKKRIAFIGGPASSRDSRQRFEGYQAALRQCGLPFSKTLVVPGDFFSYGAEAVRLLQDERQIRFDALASANDHMALFAIKELVRRGIRVPEDVAVVGFDDIRECRHVHPRLTTVRQSFHALGRESVRTMIDLLDGKSAPRTRTLPTRVMIRESCGCTSFAKHRAILAGGVPRRRRPPVSAGVRLTGRAAAGVHAAVFAADMAACVPTVAEIIDLVPFLTKFFSLLAGRDEAAAREKILGHVRSGCLRLLECQEDITEIHRFVVLLCDGATERRGRGTGASGLPPLREEALLLVGFLIEDRQAEKPAPFAEGAGSQLAVNEFFTDRLNLVQLGEFMSSLLPKIPFRGFAMCLYVDERKTQARVLMHSGLAAIPSGRRWRDPFPVPELLPAGQDRRQAAARMVAALYFKETPLGYVVFDLPDSMSEASVDSLATQMSNAVKSAMLVSELAAHARGLEAKVRERTAELAAANEEKTGFFVKIAHETKTPLTLIGTYLERYIAVHGLTEELGVLKRNIDKLTQTMIHYLNTERIERGAVVYRHDQIADVSAIAGNAASLFREQAGVGGRRFSAAVEPGVFVRLDPDAMERILNNLLSNALRFTKRGGSVELSLRRVRDSVELCVRDDGIGLSAAQKPRIFDRYYQGASVSRTPAGSGMGLHIVKEIMDELAAKIAVDSRPGRGTVIFCRFRRSRPPVKTVAARPRAGRAPQTVQAVVPAPEDRPRILFVEDDAQLASALMRQTQDAYHAQWARDGREALRLLRGSARPHVIVSDIIMDGMDGRRLLAEVEKDAALRDIPFVFLTALDSARERLAGLRRGAVDFITKPFSMAELIAKIDSLVKMQEALKENSLRLLGDKLFRLLERTGGERAATAATGSTAREKDPLPAFGISNMELKVIALLKLGLVHKEIGGRLGISTTTVRTYIARVYRKCQVNTKIQLFRKLGYF